MVKCLNIHTLIWALLVNFENSESRLYPAYLDLLQHGYFRKAAEILNQDLKKLERVGKNIKRFKCPKWTTLHGCRKVRLGMNSTCENSCRYHSCGNLDHSEAENCLSSLLGGISGSKCRIRDNRLICRCQKFTQSGMYEDDNSICSWKLLK